MATHLEGEWLPKERVVSDEGRILAARHSNLPTLIRHGCISADERSRLIVFTTVRNPFDYLISTYFKMRAIHEGSLPRPHALPTDARLENLAFSATHPFEQWVLRRWRRPGVLGRLRGPIQARYNHTKDTDHVLRFERLQDDFSELMAQIGYAGPLELPHINTTSGRERDYQRYYTKKARLHVEQAWSSELDRYGYRY